MTIEKPINDTISNDYATIDTVSNREVDLLHPTESMIDIGDIANGLSLICRFGGQIPRFYSVAQHSVLVQALCPGDLKLEGLLHDGSEAYLGDVTKPLKTLLGAHYKGLEYNFETLIFQKFGLDISRLQEVKKYDLMAYELEDRALRKNDPAPLIRVLGNAGMLIAETEAYWRPLVAKMEFLRIFTDLYNHTNNG